MPDVLLAPFDVVVVPFPFTDSNASRRRPALVLSSSAFNQKAQHSVMAMITSAGQSSWLSDYFIEDLDVGGGLADRVLGAAQTVHTGSSAGDSRGWYVGRCGSKKVAIGVAGDAGDLGNLAKLAIFG